jgi:hypothetical membrane protein
MSALSILTIAAVALWVALVVVAQLLAPEQSPLSMGMSGLARARHGWIMRLAFVVRGAAALLMVAAVVHSLAATDRSVVGLVLFAVWGVGSALLAVFNTDMPGETLTRHGKAHASIAGVAYLAAVVAMLSTSFSLPGDQASAWALRLAYLALFALIAQYAAFGAQARAAAAARAAAGGPAVKPDGPLDIPPPRALARYAGLLQRVFLALVMLWTVVVAASLG